MCSKSLVFATISILQYARGRGRLCCGRERLVSKSPTTVSSNGLVREVWCVQQIERPRMMLMVLMTLMMLYGVDDANDADGVDVC